MLASTTLKFLKSLKKNNNKPWFDEHRKDYDAAKEDFMGFIQQVIDQHGKKDTSISSLTAKQTIFRINRDVRFSKDKSPYKTNMGASINKGGRKAMHAAGYYFHLEPGNSFMGGGLYMPDAEILKKVRQEVDYNFATFKKIINNKKFKENYIELDHSAELSLTRVPKGYEPDNPAAEFLKLKSYIAMIPVTDEELLSKSLVKKTADAFATLQPLLDFLNESID